LHAHAISFFPFAFCLRATACETYYFVPCLNGIPTHHTAKEWILSRLWREIIAYFHKQAPLWPERWLGLAAEKSHKNMGSLISQNRRSLKMYNFAKFYFRIF
jgi:hypothetical protein